MEGSWASRTAAEVAGWPRAQSSETDFGAEKVRSKPGTGPWLRETPPLPISGSGGGVVAGEHRAQLIAHDVALESELGGSVAGPAPRRLALAGVVVLGAVGDLLQVVALLARSQLSDREHPPSLSRERAICVISPAAVILREGRRRWGKRGAAGVQPRLLKSARPGSERLLGAGGLVPGGGSLPVTTQRRDREARCRHRRPIRGPAAQHV